MHTNKIRNLIISVGLAGIASLIAANSTWAQSPATSPSPAPATDTGNYKVASSFEVGYRFLSVNGDYQKYRSDLNYRAGVRLLDSSILIEKNGDAHTLIDNALITTSGWGSDPSGSVLVKMNKTGIFKFDANVRRVLYFNNLKNFATNWSQPLTTGSEHQFNTRHYFGDYDLVVAPENEKFRAHIGFGFNNTDGPGTYTMRWPAFGSTTFSTRGDEFQVNSRIKNRSRDVRLGAEGNLAGFNWGINYGHRNFQDNQRFTIDTLNRGNNPLANTASINSFFRNFPTKGMTDYVSGSLQRTFERKLDFTGRIIYSKSRTNFNQLDEGNGLSSFSSSSSPQIIVDLDQANVSGNSKRNQTRGDLGVTYRANDVVRISDTFNFDQFGITGQNRFFEYLMSHTTAGVLRPNDFSDNTSWRLTKYHRYTNLLEADFQVTNRFAFNVGYRYSRRNVGLAALDRNMVSGIAGLNEAEDYKNTTNSVIAGTKIRPAKNWSIFADFEHGKADTPFTRLANGKFTNFRVRTRASLKNVAMNVSFITKDNDNPGEADCGGLCTLPITPTIAKTKNRVFSASVDWTPTPEITFSSGYTYNHLNTTTDIIVPVGSPAVPTTTWFLGTSRYFMRDTYFNFDVTARPMKRVSLYASYRINNDPGQGNLAVTRLQDIYSSYPMRFQTPEGRLTIKLNKNIDWNLGYQYYSYRETPVQNPLVLIVITGQPNVPQFYPAQNYTAHLPYTSLRIYFGGGNDR